jgi:hypothetical protein
MQLFNRNAVIMEDTINTEPDTGDDLDLIEELSIEELAVREEYSACQTTF